MGREEHCKQISLACVGSACSVSATLGLSPLMACVLSVCFLHCLGSRLLSIVFPVVMYGCESWTVKKSEAEELMLLNCGVGGDS